MQAVLVLIGLTIAAATLAAILWSITYPERRHWPPKHYTKATPILVWVPTFTLFGILIILGVLNWGSLPVPIWLRFGAGIPLIVAGNAIVWSEVAQFGIAQTGGAQGSLRTSGMYRYSRNPQYVADIAMIVGWIVLCASSEAVLVGFAGIAVLIAAPFAEEPWLKEQYGSVFEDYRAKVRRFL
ncbi:phosphatidylethanolamine N-methyltransferase family protein [Octadecabacter sp. CECT 8868]|uniref:methyltransferase family protein n=1 Tax=Octadecabacter algicola TaxID=2909342 RepID=UPI001F1E0241|nr:PEMT/PEM2 methyltransferase family protein [Octadecabacter algicola]MCF2904042.1 phosphatidylethanolamine N-methyltransferase family protein [Octadecabacter algicola]